MTKQQTQYAIEVMEAWLEGKPIEVNQFGRWTDLRTDRDPKWNWEILYRIKDPLREFKEAYSEGKTIQHLCSSRVSGQLVWADLEDPDWDDVPDSYRVKPEPRRFWILDRNLCTSEKDAKEALGVFGNVICVEEVLE